jgi:outer membrane protein assembly factor BamB/orotate phosphoribosyltransferase
MNARPQPLAPAARSEPPEVGRDDLRRAILEQVVRLSGGPPSFDFKELLTRTRYARAAGRALWALVRHLEPDVLVGPGFGGAPLLYATALAAADADGRDLAIWMVRDQRKSYYGKRWVEGPRLEGRPRAVILDDFLGRGTAIELVDQALAAESMQAEVCGIGVLLDAWAPLGSRQLRVSRCPVFPVFLRHEIGMTRDCHDARPPLMTGAAPPALGRPAWRRLGFNGASDCPLKSAPAIADGDLFAADDRSRVWRIDGRDGEARWCTPSVQETAKGIVQRLQVVGGSVAYGCYDGTVTRLDASDGRIVWRLRVGSAVHATPEVDLAAGRVFVNVEAFDHRGPGGWLAALDWRTGRTLWRHPHAFWPPGTPAHDPASGAVVATCNDRTLVCVDDGDGRERWRAATEGVARGRPAIAAGRVVVADEAGWLQVFDLMTGELLGRRRYGGTTGEHQFTLVDEGVVMAYDDTGQLLAFALDDLRLLWLSTLRTEGVCTPVAAGGHLYVLSRAGNLAVLERRGGRKVWEGHVEGRQSHAPAVGELGGELSIVCASDDAGLQAFRIHPHYG